MQKEVPSIHAAIDIGSNTIHLVVARCTHDNLDILEEATELVHIEESVTKTGEISPEKCDATLATLRRYQALAKQHGAEEVLVVAREALRQAHNSSEFLQQVQQKTGLQVHLISGTVEAALTFYRATLDAYEACCKPKPFKKAYRCINKIADELGSERDADVILQGLHAQLDRVLEEEQAGVQWFIDRLESYHKQRQKILETSLQTLDEKALKQQIKVCIPKGA